MGGARNYFRGLVLAVFMLGLALAPVAPAGGAEKYPAKTITVTIPFTGAGASQVIYRALFDVAEKILGQPMVIVNKPGSGGAVGWTLVQAMKPDGYNLAYVSNSLFLHTHRTKGRLNYMNFEPIVRVNETPCAVSVNVASGIKNLGEFLKNAKAKPGKVRVGNAGAGAFYDLCTYELEKLTGTQLVHVPYQGGPLAGTALLGGHIEATMVTTADLSNVLDTGKIRILALAGRKRDPIFPDIPTMKEAGVDMDMVLWRGIAAPKGISKEKVAILGKALRQATEDPKYVAFMKKAKFSNDFMPTAEFREAYFKEGRDLIELVKKAEKK